MRYGDFYGINQIPLDKWGLFEKIINDNHKFEESTVIEYDNITSVIDKNARRCEQSWIDVDKSIGKKIYDYIFPFINSYNLNESKWNLNITGLESMQLTLYSQGDYSNWHRDQSNIPRVLSYTNNQEVCRKISVSIMLSDPEEYGGGEIDIETKSPLDDIRYETFKLPKRSIIVFQSDVWHRVRPITFGLRKSLVGWFFGPPYT
jgi:PKHD-type hydroxylase